MMADSESEPKTPTATSTTETTTNSEMDLEASTKTASAPTTLLRGNKLALVEKLSRSFVKHPKKLFLAVWVVILLLSLIVFSQGWFDIQETTTYDWTIASSDDSQNEDALLDAREQLDTAQSDESAPVRSKAVTFSDTQIIFEWEDPNKSDNILTPENLQLMCKFQRVLTGHPDYPKFCKLASPSDAKGKDSECVPAPYDIVAKFYLTEQQRKDCPLLPLVDLISLGQELGNVAKYPENAFFFTRTAQEDQGLRKTRSNIPLYGPLGSDSTPDGKAYQTVLDGLDKNNAQFKVYDEFLVDKVEKDMWEYLGMEAKPFSSAYNSGPIPLGNGMQVRFHSWYARDTEFQRLVASDQFLVSGAVLFVGVIMTAHTRSLFITVNGMFSILVSIPVALFIYSGILRVLYWSDIHIVVIFLVLGIGANDVFVFFDAFRQSKTMWGSLRGIASEEDALARNLYGTGDGDSEVLVARMAYTLTRASGTLFTTSFTTFAAFMATGISPVVPVAAFGIYAAIAILVNFIFTLILYPSFVIIYHKHFEGGPFCCPCVRDRTKEEREAAQVKTATSAALHDDKDSEASEDEDEKLHRLDTCEEKVFSKLYVPLLELGKQFKVGARSFTFRPVAVISIIGLLVLFVIMGGYTFELETPKQRDEPFSESHMFFGFLDDFANEFVGGSDYMQVTMTWGIKGIDRQDFSTFDPNGNRGVAVFDENFDLTPSKNQQYILDVCDKLLELSCIPEGETEPLPGCVPEEKAVIRVSCTMKDFVTWHEATYGESPLPLGDSDPTEWLDRLKNFSKVEQREEDVGFVGGKLKFFVIKYESSLKTFSPETIKTPILEILDGFLEDVETNAPAQLKSVFHTSFDMTWTNSELGIVDGMYSGLAISLPVAYVVVLFATGNLVLSGFVIVAIVSIVACVLGAAYLLGWALGVGEAIAAVMVVGLSVDHSLILGSVYSHLGKEGVHSREKKFRLSSIQMGPTVLAGAFTTGGSAAIMFLCQLNFFTKMATLIVLTMSYSLLYTFFFFLSLCLLIGPQGHFGDWIYYLRKCFCKSNSAKEI